MAARIPASLGESTTRPMPALLWLAAAISLLAAASPRDLWAPDEPRYGEVAREMLETGDWLVPRLAGEPYAEKPPLGFWAMAAAGRVLGGDVGPFAARLFPALLTAVAAFSLARLVRRWFGDPALGDTAALLFATTGLILWDGSRAILDPPMAAFGLLAVEAGTALVVRRSIPAAAGFGLAIGAGLLTKGPHALVVPACALVGGCVASGAARRLLDVRWLLGLAVAGAVAAAWAFPAMEAGGEAYSDRLVGQLSDRVGGHEVPHKNPVWYLPALLLAAALPWWPLALPAARLALRPSLAAREHRFGLGACVAAVLGPLVLLSIPASKRDVYLIPSLPFVAALAAYGVHRFAASRLVRLGVGVLPYALAGVALALVAAPILLARGVPDGSRVVRAPFDAAELSALGGAFLVATTGAIATARLRRSVLAAVRAGAVALAATWVVVATLPLGSFDPWKTHVEGADAAAREAPGVPLAIAGFSDLSVRWWYRDRAVRRHADGRGFARLLAPGAPPTLVLAKSKHWYENAPDDWRASGLPRPPARILREYAVGGTGFVLATNVPPRRGGAGAGGGP